MNPNAEHDIYGCPGVTDERIEHLLDQDAKLQPKKLHRNRQSVLQQELREYRVRHDIVEIQNNVFLRSE
jgi:hypothetical protein